MSDRTIVVGVDGSPEAEGAMLRAADIAEAGDAELVAVFVRHTPAPTGTMSVAAMGQADAAFDAIEVQVEADLVTCMADRDLRWTFDTGEGDPATYLMRVADERGADLIVVGHRGKSQVGSLLLGSVATKLVHHAKQSVLIARPQER